MKYEDSFDLYDTNKLKEAKSILFEIYTYNYTPCSYKAKLLETVINKLDNLITKFGKSTRI